VVNHLEWIEGHAEREKMMTVLESRCHCIRSARIALDLLWTRTTIGRSAVSSEASYGESGEHCLKIAVSLEMQQAL
jgi:hypothetical protein